MFLIGLTGGIASGKSTVCKMLKSLDIPIIDADEIAHLVVEPNKPAWVKIKEEFGPTFFKENGELDREMLGRHVFSDSEARKKLNQITHSFIHKEMRKQVWNYFWKGEQFVVLEIPLLYETRRALDYMYKVIVVRCEDELQLSRLQSRNKLSEHEAILRIEAQMPLDEKCDLADFVIENSGTATDTRQQVDAVVKLLRSSNQHIWNRMKLLTGFVCLVGLFVAIILKYLS